MSAGHRADRLFAAIIATVGLLAIGGATYLGGVRSGSAFLTLLFFSGSTMTMSVTALPMVISYAHLEAPARARRALGRARKEGNRPGVVLGHVRVALAKYARRH